MAKPTPAAWPPAYGRRAALRIDPSVPRRHLDTYEIKEQLSGPTSSNGGPKEQLSLKHDLEGHQSCLEGGVVQGIKGLPGAKPHNLAK
ncbi:hypothetical protein U9M48_043164 [Paspalum notatum var. saurae]|uniref:Uncharacterized protein n=1 Tax=Paspalum notatum var. saurae TaxID=547442 RepID=A0AAQ3XG65_PASNO